MGQPGDVVSTVLVGEDLEQPTVYHGVEPVVEVSQRQGVYQEELSGQAPLLCPPVGFLDRPSRKSMPRT